MSNKNIKDIIIDESKGLTPEEIRDMLANINEASKYLNEEIKKKETKDSLSVFLNKFFKFEANGYIYVKEVELFYDTVYLYGSTIKSTFFYNESTDNIGYSSFDYCSNGCFQFDAEKFLAYIKLNGRIPDQHIPFKYQYSEITQEEFNTKLKEELKKLHKSIEKYFPS